jgi:hypothetical protein
MINLSDVINAGVVYPGSPPSIPEISVIPKHCEIKGHDGAHNVSTAIARPNRWTEENQRTGVRARPGDDRPEREPAEAEPTDNCSGAPVDLDRVERSTRPARS